MFMDNIKQFSKKGKSIGKPNTVTEGVQRRQGDGICHRKMYNANKEK